MAGARLDFEIDDRELRRALRRLARFQRTEALSDVGEAMVNATRERFREQRGPDGEPWEPLSDRYKRRKKRNKDKILIASGDLMGLLRHQVDGDELAWGTDRIYGATHQFGDEDRNIPARPYLGVSDDDERQIKDILTEHVRKPLTRG